MPSEDWVPKRVLELVALCTRWKASLEDLARLVAYGWDQGEVTEVLDKIDAFLTAQSAYEADNSTTKRLVKNEASEKHKGILPESAAVCSPVPPNGSLRTDEEQVTLLVKEGRVWV